MRPHLIQSKTILALVGLVVAATTAKAASAPASEWVARVESVSPGGAQFEVTDRHGERLRVALPARPPQAHRLYRSGALVNTSVLREGETVLVTGVRRGNWLEASRVELLSDARVGAATPAEQLLRFTGFDGPRQLRAVGADGARYRIVFPPKPQKISVWKVGGLAELSALQEGDRLSVRGVAFDHTIRAEWVEVLDQTRLGEGAAIPLRLTYRGSAGWRRLIGEAADGSRYVITLPRRPQAIYFQRNGTLVEPSALQPGDVMDVTGVIHADTVQASQIVLR